jgi:hypothetical protein
MSFNALRESYSPVAFAPLSEAQGSGDEKNLAVDPLTGMPPNAFHKGWLGATGTSATANQTGCTSNGVGAVSFNGTAANAMVAEGGLTSYIGWNATSSTPQPFAEEIWFKTSTAGQPLAGSVGAPVRSAVTGPWNLVGYATNYTASSISGSYEVDRVIYLDGSGNIGFYLENSDFTKQSIASSGTNFADGNCHQAFVTYVPQTGGANPLITIYVDSNQVAQANENTANPFPFYDNDSIGFVPFYGINGTTDDYFTGILQDFAVYSNETFTLPQIQQLYASRTNTISDAASVPVVKTAKSFVSSYGYDAGGIQGESSSYNKTYVFQANVTANPSAVQTVAFDNTSYLSAGSVILAGDGANREAVYLTAVNTGSNTVTGRFYLNHASGSNAYNGGLSANLNQTIAAFEAEFVPGENAGLRDGYTGGSNLLSATDPVFQALCAAGITHAYANELGQANGTYNAPVSQTVFDQQVEYNGGPSCINFIEGSNEPDDGNASNWELSAYAQMGYLATMSQYYNKNILPSSHPTSPPLLNDGVGLGHPSSTSVAELNAFYATLGNTTITQAITGSTTAQAVNVATASVFVVGQPVQVVDGANSEVVSVTAINTSSSPNTVTGVFTLNHASGLALNSPTFAQLVDRGNIHWSPGNTFSPELFSASNAEPPETWYEYATSYVPGAAPKTGEFGYQDNQALTGTSTSVLPAPIYAYYINRTWAESFRKGFGVLYEDNANDTYFQNFGYEGAVIDMYGNVKPPWYETRSLMQTLADPNPSTTFTPTQYQVKVTTPTSVGNGVTANIKTIPLQWSTGQDWLVFWNADTAFPISGLTMTSTPLPYYPQTATFTLPAGTTWVQVGQFGTTERSDSSCLGVTQGRGGISDSCYAELNADLATFNWTSPTVTGSGGSTPSITLTNIQDNIQVMTWGTGTAPATPSPVPSPPFTPVPTPAATIAPSYTAPPS